MQELASGTISHANTSEHAMKSKVRMIYYHSIRTVKTFGLHQPYFGHLSSMPVVCVTHALQTSKGCFLFESKLKCS